MFECCSGPLLEEMRETCLTKLAIVVTTINQPTQAVLELRDGCHKHSGRFYVMGDSKSPKDFALPGADYLDVDAQVVTGFEFAKIVPTRHYARKNVGYLCAIRDKAQMIIETDDDNLPLEDFWHARTRKVKAKVATAAGWHNVYRHFSDANIWPRGLPLDKVLSEPESFEGMKVVERDCPIQQGLADDNPDVDAIYRLVLPLPIKFKTGRKVILDPGVWCPFNSQNTAWWPDAYPLLYLPYHCSFRMTDIWRSFVAQRIAWENGWSVLFHSATMWQDRNEHNLMRDFADEVVGYLNNDKIAKALDELNLAKGTGAMGHNLIKCYDTLIGLGVVGAEERPLLKAWVSDLEKLA